VKRTFLAVQLSFKDHDLVPQRQDLGILVPLGARYEP